MLAQLNLTVWAWIESFKDLKRRAVWAPFLWMVLIQSLVLLALTEFYRPVFSWILVPILKGVGDVRMLHYPAFFSVLPAFYGRFDLVLDVFFGSLFFGTAYLVLFRVASRMPVGDAWNAGRRSYLVLLLLRLPLVLLVVLASWGLPLLLGGKPGVGLEGKALREARYGSFLIGVLGESLCLYAPLARLVAGRSLFGSFGDSLRLAARVPLATMLVVLLPNLLQLPVAAAIRRSDTIITNLTPEVVAWLLFAGILVYTGVNYVVIGSAVRIFGARGAEKGAAS